MTQNYHITSEYITLGQFLKEICEVPSGGAAKYYLADFDVLVNGEIERRRGRKLYVGMSVTLPSGENYSFIEE